MTYCPNCGTQASGSFCPNCGTPLGASAGAAPQPVGAPAASSSGLSNNIAAALCYVFGIVGGVVFLLIDPYKTDKYVRFHAFQSIFLTLAVIAISFLFGIFIVFTHGLGILLGPIYNLLLLILWIYMIVTAYQGKRIMLPVIGDVAAKQA